MELSDECDELAGATKLLHYLPQAISADCVKGLCQIDKGHEEVAVLLLTFLLELSRSKNHVCCPSPSTKATLAFWEETLLKVLEKAVEQDAGQDLPCYGQEGDATVIVTRLAVAFPFVDVDYMGIFQLLWDLSSVPHRLEDFRQPLHDGRASYFIYLSRDCIGSWGSAICELPNCSFYFIFCGGDVQVLVDVHLRETGNGLIVDVSGSVEDTVEVFSPPLQNLFFSVSSLVPSAFSRGGEPEDWGP